MISESNLSKKQLKNVPGVIDASEVAGVYDIVVKITSDTLIV